MYLLFAIVAIFCSVHCNTDKPHIIAIIADDLGWNDVGFHGSSEIPTPNIDALAYNGVILDRHYTQTSCTPSRAAFLTGQYPIRFGYQGTPLFPGESRTIPHHIKTLPRELKLLGYKTHLVGKWHLGAGHRNNTPIGYGYDSHYGYWNGYIGYFNQMVSTGSLKGIDWHDNLKPITDDTGAYVTDLLTTRAIKIISNHSSDCPLFLSINHLAPHTGKIVGAKTVLEVKNINYVNKKFGYIGDPVRRLLAAKATLISENIVGNIASLTFINYNLKSKLRFLTLRCDDAVAVGIFNSVQCALKTPIAIALSLLNSKFRNGSFVRAVIHVVERMDESVGSILRRLHERGFLENSIVIFFSDNGAPTRGSHANHGSNFPLRGIKLTNFEGAARSPAIIYSNKLKDKGRLFKKLFHITDWVPTLYAAAGGDPAIFGTIDGIDQWGNICLNRNEDVRNNMLVHLDEAVGNSAIIGYNGMYKLINGTQMQFDNYTGEPGSYDPVYLSEIERSPTNNAIAESERRAALTVERLEKLRMDTKSENCRPVTDASPCNGRCLYNIQADPCEANDIYQDNPAIVASLWDGILKFKSELVPQQNKPVDPRSDPNRCNGTWYNFLDGPNGCYYNASII